MAFPSKFKSLIELSLDQVEKPTSAWLNFGVCASSNDACGWQGWILESVEAAAHGEAKVLPSDEDLNCPKCGNPLFRTEVSYKFDVSLNQAPKLIPNVDYEVMPVLYDDDED